MPHFVTIKKQIKTDILKALEKAGELDYDKTLAQFSLDTGFTEKVIKEIVKQMIQLNYIRIFDGVIHRPVTPANQDPDPV